MRSDDFSRAPRIARASAMVVVEVPHAGVMGWMRSVVRHRRVVRRLRRSEGYCGHRTYWRPRWVLGTVAWFATAADLERFARAGVHPQLTRWAREPGEVADASVAVYEADPQGYTNGVWRAEQDVLAAIEHFTPVRGETEGPPVARRRRGTSPGTTGTTGTGS